MAQLSGAALPATFLTELASVSQTMAALMKCVCRSWREAASGEQAVSDHLAVIDKNHPGPEAARRFRYQKRILEALKDPKHTSKVESVILMTALADENSVAMVCCSVCAGLPYMTNLSLIMQMKQLTPLLYLPSHLAHLEFSFDCEGQRSVDLEVLNSLTQLITLYIHFLSRSEPVKTEEDRCYLMGDIKLQNLQALRLEATSNHYRGSLLASQLTLQHIPASCAVSIQSVLVRRGVRHANCKRVWGYDRIQALDYCQLNSRFSIWPFDDEFRTWYIKN